MTKMRILSLALMLGVVLYAPQTVFAAPGGTVGSVAVSGTTDASPHSYTLEVRQSDGTTVIGSRLSPAAGTHPAGTGAAAVAAPFAGAYDATLSGTVNGTVVALTDTANRNFRCFVSVDGGVFTEITGPGASVTLGGITFTAAPEGHGVPALSGPGAALFLLLAASVIFLVRRRRSGMSAA